MGKNLGPGALAALFILAAAPIAAPAAQPKPTLAFQATRDDSTTTVPTPGRAFLFSVVVPGTGQWLLGQDRWPPYAALELWALIQLVDARREGRNLERSYRDLAWQAARRVSAGPRQDSNFEYYEALSSFRASGAFDSNPTRAGIQPEMDESTYNGAIWALAGAIFWPPGQGDPPEDSPDYEQALTFYRARAYAPEFAWDWGQNGLEQESYMRLIRHSDEVLRRATIVLGMLVGNHLLSAVDAMISARLKARVPPAPIEVRMQQDIYGVWFLTLQIPH